jgi:hypothetical protein
MTSASSFESTTLGSSSGSSGSIDAMLKLDTESGSDDAIGSSCRPSPETPSCSSARRAGAARAAVRAWLLVFGG